MIRVPDSWFRSAFLLALFVSSAACGGDPDASLASTSRRVFGPLPETMPGRDGDTPEMVALGQTLFSSTELSVNGRQSCQSCHMLDAAGVDRLRRPAGALGALGDRNTPTVFNAGFHAVQFWDGREDSLETQALVPILNPVEMAMPSEAAIVERLNRPEVRRAFERAFPAEADPVTLENLGRALAAFQRTLVSRSRFDSFQEGDLDALTAGEKEGLRVFMKTGCASCHGGPLLGGNILQKLGIVNPYDNEDDLGRARVTQRNRDRFVFKVPSLRNVALTAPYFHDGRVATLPEAVEKMAWLQLGYEIPVAERDAIVAFLETLTDEALMARKTARAAQ